MNINEIYSGKKHTVILFLILILSILPFLVLNYYNQPTTEDFYFSEAAKKFGFSETYSALYKTWGGRYFGYILVPVNPLYFNSIGLYKFSTFALIIFLLLILIMFIKEYTKSRLTFSEIILISFSIFFSFLYSMPSAGQGLYWLVSVIFYNLGLIFIMLFCIFYFRQNYESNLKLKIYYTILCAIAASASAGSNELAAASVFLLAALFAGINIYKEYRVRFTDLFIFITTVFSVYFAYSSPANSIRPGYYKTSGQIVFSITNTFSFLSEKLLNWVFLSPLLIVSILVIPLLLKSSEGKREPDIFKINPFIPVTVSVMLLFVQTFLTYWSIGEAPYDRILNFIFFTFLICWFYNLGVFVTHYRIKVKNLYEKLPQFAYTTLSIVIILAFIFIDSNNIKTAYTELLDGSAEKYDNRMEERYKFISESKTDSVEIESITEVPKSFFLLDISKDPDVLYNIGYAGFFNKKAVYVK